MKKNEKFIVYRDLKECADKNGYEVVPCQPRMVIAKEGVLPGLFGFPDLHIRHLYSDNLLIVCSTDYKLTKRDEQEIIKVARARFGADGIG